MEIAILIVSLFCLAGIGVIVWGMLIILGAVVKFTGLGNAGSLTGKKAKK